VNATQKSPSRQLRWALTAGGVAASIVFAGGCESSDSAPSATASPSPPTGAAPGADVQAQTRLVCQAINRSKGDFFRNVAEGKDPSRVLVDAMKTFSASLKAQAPKATDPALATALREAAAAADAVAAAPDPEKADEAPFQEAGTKLDKICADAEPAAKKPAAGGATIGGAASACPLPVTFEVAASWKPKAVDVKADDPLAELVRKGPLAVVCEIDAKPAGHLGFIRVWAGSQAKGAARESLDTVLKGDDVRKPVYTNVTVGGQPGVEVVYQAYSKLLEESREQRAFAVQTPHGAVVVALGGTDTDEHRDMLPAYELVKRTLAVNS
jgi:hypothetical protein